MSAFDSHPKRTLPRNRRDYPLGLRYQLLPGGRYKLATLEALSATALNSAGVQALEVVTSEI
ncbi:MAG: hypothetical protein WA322_09270, partial [Pseudolabrys sp.]